MEGRKRPSMPWRGGLFVVVVQGGRGGRRRIDRRVIQNTEGGAYHVNGEYVVVRMVTGYTVVQAA